MGTKRNPGKFDCYNAAADDEPMFVLLARDENAPALVGTWVEWRLAALMRDVARRKVTTVQAHAKFEKILEAAECAAAMRVFQDDESVRMAGLKDAATSAPSASSPWAENFAVENVIAEGRKVVEAWKARNLIYSNPASEQSKRDLADAALSHFIFGLFTMLGVLDFERRLPSRGKE